MSSTTYTNPKINTPKTSSLIFGKKLSGQTYNPESNCGQPLLETDRSYFEHRFGHDFSKVRVHNDAQAAVSAEAINAHAYTVGRDIVFSAGLYNSKTLTGRGLLAHELAHVIQQERGGNTPELDSRAIHEQDAETAAKVAISGQGFVNVKSATGVGIARARQDWLESTPNIQQWSYTELHDEIDEIQEWLNNQIQSSPETVRLEEVLQLLRAEVRRKRKLAMQESPKKKRRKRGRRKKSKSQQLQDDFTMSTETKSLKPRILRERSSVEYKDPEDMRREIDLIMDWINRKDLNPEDRSILQMELQNLTPSLQKNRVQKATKRRNNKIQQALTPTISGDARVQLVETVKLIDSIKPLPFQPDYSSLMHGDEMIVLRDIEVKAIRQHITKMMDNAAIKIKGVNQRAFNKWAHQARVNREEAFAGFVVSLFTGEDAIGPYDQMNAHNGRADNYLSRYRAKRRQGTLVQMAEAIGKAEENALKAKLVVDKWVGDIITTGENVVTGLTITRDASFAIAGSIAAVVAAPVVAAGAAGAGLTGVGAFAATTAGTGAVVGTGSAVVRGGSAGIGELASGGSLEDIVAATKKEGGRGLKEGVVAGVTGGAAHTLGTTLGVGREGIKLTSQLGRRWAAEGTADFIGGATDAALRGKSFGEVLTAGGTQAALGVPGVLVGGVVKNPGVRAVAETTVSSGTAFGTTLASGGTTKEAIVSGSTAAISSVAVRRATRSSQPNTRAQQRAFAAGKRARGSVDAAGRKFRSATAAAMIGLADSAPVFRLHNSSADITSVLPANRRASSFPVAVDADVKSDLLNRSATTDPVDDYAPRQQLPGDVESTGTRSGSQVSVVTRLQDVDISPTSLPPQQRIEYEQQFAQYHRDEQAAFDAGRRQTPPMTRENYIRFRHGIVTGQIIPSSSSNVNALIDDALTGAVYPERAFGFTQVQTDAAGVVLGRPMTSSEIDELGQIWRGRENVGEAATLTRENSRQLFDNHRNRFWRAVRGSASARSLFENMGFTFPENPTTAPVRVLPDGRTVRVTIDHILERQADPSRAIDANNLRFSFGRENSIVLRLLNELDPFQRHP